MDSSTENLKNIIYNSYLTFLEKFKNKPQTHEQKDYRQRAYTQTVFATKKLLENNSYNGFTKTNNIRSTLKNTYPVPQDCIDTILDTFVDIMLKKDNLHANSQVRLYNAMTATKNSRGKDQVIKALNQVIKNGNYSYFSRYYNGNESKNYRKLLMEALTPTNISTMLASIFINSIIQEKQHEKQYETISKKVGNNYPQLHDFQLNPDTINQCREDILNKVQFNFERRDYSLGDDLFASIDLGKKKKNQEDSVIILKHPQNPKFKMMVVADGMGGLIAGEMASTFITTSMIDWFENLDPKFFDEKNTQALTQYFENQITTVNNKLYQTYKGQAGSTFVGAIVTDKNTIISNIGDSRAYIYADGKLQQLTEDDNLAFNLWKKGTIKNKDDIRFYKYSNKITKAMGTHTNTTPSTKTISNSDFDILLLCSDGVHECLSDNTIKVITRNTSPRHLAKVLMHYVNDPNVDKKFHGNSSGNYNFDPVLSAGKDNASIAVFDNNKDKGR